MRKEVKALKPHVSINVRNVTESIEFYRKMLGIEPAKVRTGYAKVFRSPRLTTCSPYECGGRMRG